MSHYERFCFLLMVCVFVPMILGLGIMFLMDHVRDWAQVGFNLCVLGYFGVIMFMIWELTQ